VIDHQRLRRPRYGGALRRGKTVLTVIDMILPTP